MSTLASAPESAGPGDPAASTPPPARSRRASAEALIGLGLAAGLLAVVFLTDGGVDTTTPTPGNTWTEIVLTLLGGGALAVVALRGAPGRAWGAATVGLMAALAALTALSIIWSVVPDTSWSAANQMLSYLAALAGGAAMARLAPARWPALVGAIAMLMAALCGWALLVKVFPATLGSSDSAGRLQAPFGYWNATGLSGALGLPACLWAAARRERGRLVAVLTVPAMMLLLSTIVLSYSRSADAAAVIGIGGWLLFVPLRLRSVAMLAVAAAGAAVVCAYVLATSGLSSAGATLAAQDSSGHTFGVVLAIVLALVTGGGWACVRAIDRRSVPPAVRRRIAATLIVVACLIPVAAIGAVAVSSRGLTGQVSHVWDQLTSTRSVVYNNPGRVFQFGSSRPVYWHEGIDVGRHALLKGVGASGFGIARLRYTSDPSKVDQAHSYVFETFADLGLIGIAVTVALLVAWLLAARRPLELGTRWRTLSGPQSAEREAMVALALIVVSFGVQSTLDWTWYFPGISVPVLLCAGWLAGRGPLGQRVGWLRSPQPLLDRPGAVAIAAALAAVTLTGAWFQWQPQRSYQDYQAGIGANSDTQALADERSAVSSDPLAYLPRFALAEIEQSDGNLAAARAQLVSAARSQPANPVVWTQLGALDLQVGKPAEAIADVSHVGELDKTTDVYIKLEGGILAQAQAELARAKARAAAASAKRK